MTSSIMRSNNFNNIIMQRTNTANNGVSVSTNTNNILFNNNSDNNNLNKIVNNSISNNTNNGLRVSRNPDLKSSYNLNNKNANFIYNIKNAVMESKYFKNITNSELSNNNSLKNHIITSNNTNNNLQSNNNSNNNNNNNQTSASLALMNKIRAIESRKKRVQTSIATNTNKGSDEDLLNSNHNQIQQPPRTPKPLNSSTPTPQYIPIATGMEINKLRKKFNKSQLEVAQKNPDQYKDKLSDQKFFDRNFKINDRQPTNTPLPATTPVPTTRSNEFSSENHYFSNNNNNNGVNSRLSSHRNEATKINIYSLTPSNINLKSNFNENLTNNNGATVSANLSSFNKLKLLKKRNLNKKLNANVNTNNINSSAKSQSNFDSVGKLTDEYDDRDENNNNNNNNNNINLRSSSNILDHHKSSQTIDESYLYEIKTNKVKSLLNDKNGLAKSSNAINTNYTPITTPASTKAKSDNCLLELIEKTNNNLESEKNMLKQQHELLPKFSKSNNSLVVIKNPFTTVINENSSILNPNAHGTSKPNVDRYRLMTKSKTEINLKNSNGNILKPDLYNKIDDSSSSIDEQQKLNEIKKQTGPQKTPMNIRQVTNNNFDKPVKQTENNTEFRIIYPGTQEVPKSSIYYYDHKNEFDDNFFMSEEFKRLFHEDEYFKEVFRKCHQWLVKHVVPNMPKITEKLKKGHKIAN